MAVTKTKKKPETKKAGQQRSRAGEAGAFTKPNGEMSKTERPMTAREIADSVKKRKQAKKKK